MMPRFPRKARAPRRSFKAFARFALTAGRHPRRAGGPERHSGTSSARPYPDRGHDQPRRHGPVAGRMEAHSAGNARLECAEPRAPAPPHIIARRRRSTRAAGRARAVQAREGSGLDLDCEVGIRPSRRRPLAAMLAAVIDDRQPGRRKGPGQKDHAFPRRTVAGHRFVPFSVSAALFCACHWVPRRATLQGWSWRPILPDRQAPIPCRLPSPSLGDCQATMGPSNPSPQCRLRSSSSTISSKSPRSIPQTPPWAGLRVRRQFSGAQTAASGLDLPGLSD